VYCIEFDSTRIITGSRDRTIKVWSLKTGRLLGTFWGAHRGSVLCLKFEGDWERGWDDESEGESEHNWGTGNLIDGTSGLRTEKKRGKEKKREKERKGFMVSGSSDCSVCVWDLTTGRVVGDSSDAGAGRSVQSGLSSDLTGASENGEGSSTDEPEREVNAEVRAVLKGHVGGVLDLRIDKRWIVSWYAFPKFLTLRLSNVLNSSKDAVIRVWDRITLDLHRTLRGHEGPVNAVGLQSEKVVCMISLHCGFVSDRLTFAIGQRKW
jgi:F-box and WD-40 domain protein 1/11